MNTRNNVTLKVYYPGQIPAKDAQAIKARLAKARDGRLKFKKMGTVTVVPPRRSRPAKAA